MMKGLGDYPLLNPQKLKAIQNEVLILRGSKDQMVNDEESTWASFYLNNGSFNVLENQPHPIEKVDLSTLRDYMLNFF